MIERTPIFNIFTQIILLCGLIVALLPFVIVVIAASHDLQTVNQVPMPLAPGGHLLENLQHAWHEAQLGTALVNSFIFASGVALAKIFFASVTAFSIVFFRYRGRTVVFWLIFVTLMLPLEVRIVPTYAVAANALGPITAVLDVLGISWLLEQIAGLQITVKWNLLNSHTGLILPLVATATGTFLFRQFFMTVPDELIEAARMDGAGPIRFFFDVLLPLSRTTMIALSTIIFVATWNQYLWPLLVTTEADYTTATIQLRELIPDVLGLPTWNVAMAGTMIIMVPPLLVMIIAQRWFIRGLISTEK